MAIEKRRFERVPFLADVKLHVLSNDVRVKANTVDLSQGGVSLFTPILTEAGESVLMTFSLPDVRGCLKQIEIAGRVVRTRIEADGNFLAVEFATPLGQFNAPVLWEHLQVGLQRRTRVGS